VFAAVEILRKIGGGEFLVPLTKGLTPYLSRSTHLDISGRHLAHNRVNTCILETEAEPESDGRGPEKQRIADN
jgi:hypothetical protein